MKRAVPWMWDRPQERQLEEFVVQVRQLEAHSRHRKEGMSWYWVDGQVKEQVLVLY